MENRLQQYRKGFPAMIACYLIWGFQPLYYTIDTAVDTVFLLACRIVWAAVACLVILKVQGKLPQLRAVFRDRAVLRREIPAAVLLLADWGIYLFAVRCGKVMEAAMGYYIMPLVMFALGAALFREPFSRRHLLALGFIAVGIVLSTGGFGGFPYVTVLLALCFAVYSACKKSLSVDSVVSTTAEILMIVPPALLYLCLFGRSELLLSALMPGRQLFLIGSGIVTGVPMVLFAVGVRYLPLSLSGIMQYLSPSLGLLCGVLMGETLSREKLISFLFIWLGVILYTVCEWRGTAAGRQRE